MRAQQVFWLTLCSDAVALLFSICAAAVRPALIDFFTVGLALCATAFALDQVFSGSGHAYTLILTAALNLLLFYRLHVFWKSRRRDVR